MLNNKVYCIIEIKTYFFISRKLPENHLLSTEKKGVVTETENVNRKCSIRPHVDVQIRDLHLYKSPQFLTSLLIRLSSIVNIAYYALVEFSFAVNLRLSSNKCD